MEEAFMCPTLIDIQTSMYLFTIAELITMVQPTETIYKMKSFNQIIATSCFSSLNEEFPMSEILTQLKNSKSSPFSIEQFGYFLKIKKMTLKN